MVFCIIMFMKLLILVFKALRKYLNSDHKEETLLRRSLGEVLKDHRMRCSMT